MQLISCALDSLVHGDGFCSVDGNITLVHRIAALHVVDEMNRSKILWFAQLVSLSPGIMVHLRTANISDKDEMVNVFSTPCSYSYLVFVHLDSSPRSR